MRSSKWRCAPQRPASPLVSTNPRRLVQGPIPLIFYHVRASTFHHYDRSMYVNGLSIRPINSKSCNTISLGNDFFVSIFHRHPNVVMLDSPTHYEEVVEVMIPSP